VSIEQQIVEWASSRPAWQRMVLRRIARGESIGAQQLVSIADQVVDSTHGGDDSFRVDDMPAGATGGQCVRLLQIRNVRNVNALVTDQELTFGPIGLTVVYGDNGSGKSGYARLIKQMVRSRHHEPILTDIFKGQGTSQQSADVAVQVGDDRRDLNWPEGDCQELTQVAFFDEACGDAFITAESEVSYRPSTLFVLDGLTRACDGVREELDKRIAQNNASARRLPSFHAGSRAARFLESLSARTSENEVELAVKVPEDVDIQVSRLAAEEARLKATDPSREKKRLQSMAAKLTRLSAHAQECDRLLAEKAQKSLRTLRENLVRKQQVAAMASGQSFDGEPVRGVGSPAWRDLWEAARRFTAQACPGHSFPVTGSGARCVLCHQELAEEASERLNRFEAFVRDTTQRELDAATAEWQQAHRELSGFIPRPADVIEILEVLAGEHDPLVKEYHTVIAHYNTRHTELLKATQSETWEDLGAVLPPRLTYDLDMLAKQAVATAETIDNSTFSKKLQETIQERLELEATRSLAGDRDNVLAEVRRLKARGRLDAAKESTDTRGITRKSAELTREFVTSVVRDWFTRESDRLKLERVTLQDIGGRKGSLHHQPAFVGAVQKVGLSKVLSEGEQTALGLAGFFT